MLNAKPTNRTNGEFKEPMPHVARALDMIEQSWGQFYSGAEAELLDRNFKHIHGDRLVQAAEWLIMNWVRGKGIPNYTTWHEALSMTRGAYDGAQNSIPCSLCGRSATSWYEYRGREHLCLMCRDGLQEGCWSEDDLKPAPKEYVQQELAKIMQKIATVGTGDHGIAPCTDGEIKGEAIRMGLSLYKHNRHEGKVLTQEAGYVPAEYAKNNGYKPIAMVYGGDPRDIVGDTIDKSHKLYYSTFK